MTRQEKRRKDREKITITRSELEAMQNKILDEGFVLAISASVVTLKEDFGWGAKSRIPNFVDHCMHKYVDIQNGKTSLMEMVDKVNRYTEKRLVYGDDLKGVKDAERRA